MSRKFESKLNNTKREASRENLNAFTVAEMLIVMLIMSLIVAAFIPALMKQRVKNAADAAGNTLTWQLVNSFGPDIFYGTAMAERVAIGKNGFEDDDNGRLMLYTANAAQNYILFKQGEITTGALILDGSGNIGLGNVDTGRASGKARTIAIGSPLGGTRTQALGNYSIAIGWGALAGDAATDANSIAIGTNVRATNENSIAMGLNSQADVSSVAIGSNVYANGSHSTAIGTNISSAGEAITSKISIGTGMPSTATNAVSIGNSAKALYSSSTAIGQLATTNTNNAVAIGYNATVDNGSVAVGPNAYAKNANTVAIGNSASAWGGQSVAIGNGATIGSGAKTGSNAGSTSTAIGSGATAGVDGTTALGAGVQTTSANQTIIGTSSNTVIIPGTLSLQDPYLTSGSRTGPKLTILGGLVSISSDKRLKNIKGKSDIGLEQIRKLKVYDYQFKADKEKTPRVGVIAQDLRKIFPTAVIKGDDGYLMISQDDMFYAMLNSIKQLDIILQNTLKDFKKCIVSVQHIEDELIALVKVEQIKTKQIKELKAKNKKLESHIIALEKSIKHKVR